MAEDPPHATALYQRAAEQEYASAQYNLGLLYDSGQGVLIDSKVATQWYRRAAEHDLAVMYAMGKGVEQDPVKGYAWSALAAD